MTDDPADRLILLGEIGPAHGIRGEVLVRSYTSDPADIAAYGPLTDRSRRQSFALTVVRVTAKGVVVRVAGANDRTAVEALRGTELYVSRSRLPEPSPGEFYHEDLIGLAAIGTDGGKLGTVVAVQNYGAGDLIEIQPPHSRDTELIPFTSACVPDVDFAGRRITVVPPVLIETGEPKDPEN